MAHGAHRGAILRIAIIVEGKTEKAFAPVLRRFLRERGLPMPKLDFVPENTRLPKGDKLRRLVERLLHGKSAADYVIALTDVYTGSREFRDASDAKAKLRSWVGDESRFHPHAAQYDFEAWLLPYWPKIQKLAGHDKVVPGSIPELVNHDKPPSFHLKEIFEAGTCRDSYIKTRDATRILDGQDLLVAIEQCPELKAFVNTILILCRGEPVP